ncbi:double-stranded RNA binding motif-containing protein [Phanerochaete sordida]|uniref:Double-stranded RNA binding motif-containing protein n=1 Tax=Phanerochaete sordida TaxID=48140 RepID=A0A9P3G111_9APHY|nr:double-stranded RNA binding motif-containing protein [Phanerochaete sordida]
MNNDAISTLNNRLQALGKDAGLSWVDHKQGEEHSPEWTSQCKLDDQVIGTGRGTQKNLAREAAARMALARLNVVDE